MLDAFHSWYDRPVPKPNQYDWDFYITKKEAWKACLKWVLSQGYIDQDWITITNPEGVMIIDAKDIEKELESFQNDNISGIQL